MPLHTNREEVLASKQWTKILDDGSYLIADGALVHLAANDAPYFSLTGERWESVRHYMRRTHRETGLLTSGAISDLLVEHLPELAPLAALHLADADGAPLHAVENGWYWYSDYDGKGTHLYEHNKSYSLTPHERAAQHLRISPSQLPVGMTRDGWDEFSLFVDTLREQWKNEAAVALALLQ